MAPLSAIQERNRELALWTNEAARANPESPYAGKFIGIVRGAVVVADDLDELGRALDDMAAPPGETFCIEAGLDYGEPEYIRAVQISEPRPSGSDPMPNTHPNRSLTVAALSVE
jgi:hypothetical protein